MMPVHRYSVFFMLIQARKSHMVSMYKKSQIKVKIGLAVFVFALLSTVTFFHDREDIMRPLLDFILTTLVELVVTLIFFPKAFPCVEWK